MAGTAASVRVTSARGTAEKQLLIEFNKLVADVELIRAAVVAIAVQIDSDNGTIGTDYAAAATITAIDTAAELLASQVKNLNGTVVSAQ